MTPECVDHSAECCGAQRARGGGGEAAGERRRGLGGLSLQSSHCDCPVFEGVRQGRRGDCKVTHLRELMVQHLLRLQPHRQVVVTLDRVR